MAACKLFKARRKSGPASVAATTIKLSLCLCLCLVQLMRARAYHQSSGHFRPIRLPPLQRHQLPLAPPRPPSVQHHHPHHRHQQQYQHQTRLMAPSHRPAQQQQQQQSNLSASFQRPAQQVGHQQPPQDPIERGKFLATLNERVYLAKLAQQQQHDQAHNHAQHARHHSIRQTKSLNHNHINNQPPSERRASSSSSSSSWSPNQLVSAGHSQAQSLKFAPAAEQPGFQQRQDQQQHLDSNNNNNGKMLICYYTTRQTAPYWPKEAREFVVPAERLSSLMEPGRRDINSNEVRPPETNRQSYATLAAGERRQLVLVAPANLPFNATSEWTQQLQQQQEATTTTTTTTSNRAPGTLAQLFLMPAALGSDRRHSITSRQDNAPPPVPISAGGQSLLTPSELLTSENNGAALGGQQQQQQVQLRANNNKQHTAAATYNLISSAPPPPGVTTVAAAAGREANVVGIGAARPVANNGESNGADFAPPAPVALRQSASGNYAPLSAQLSRSSNPANGPALNGALDVMSNNYYYYYNNNQPAATTTTTISFPSSSGAQRVKSLQMAESELSPAALGPVATASSSASSSAASPQLNTISFSPTSVGSSPANTPPMSSSFATATTAASTSNSSPSTSGDFVPSTLQQQQQQQQQQHLLKFASSSSQGPPAANVEQKLTTVSLIPPEMHRGASITNGGQQLVLSAEDLLLARQSQQQAGGPAASLNNQAATLATVASSSPLSTMFDVFGAASQYLMRFKPSALMSPNMGGLLNAAAGEQPGGLFAGPLAAQRHQHQQHQHQQQQQHFKHNSSGLLAATTAAASFISLPFSSGLLATANGAQSKTPHDQMTASSGEHATHNSSSSGSSPTMQSNTHKSVGGFLSRLSLHTSNNQQPQQRREDICGRTIQTPERRIIGGEGARYGEFPYQVHIKIAKHQCGGALVDRQSIVTAAHCVYHFITRAPVSKLQIVIGAYDIEDEQYQELPPQYFKVNKVKLHPNFRFSASHPDRYDVAILKLDKPVKYTDNVLPVCLPSRDLKFESLVGTVTGFGKTDPSLSNRYGTRLLQKVDVPIIENNECERWHRTRGIDLKIFPEMMCAGYEDGLKDACVGDSGGPLVVKTPVGSDGAFRWTLAGITSAGFGCAQSRQPGIYHRVSHTVDWILENLD